MSYETLMVRARRSRASRTMRTRPCATCLRLAQHLLHLGHELVDVRLLDDLAGHDDDAVGRDAGLVAFEIFRHQLHALIAPLERLLHDGAGDRPLLDATERDRILVE